MVGINFFNNRESKDLKISVGERLRKAAKPKDTRRVSQSFFFLAELSYVNLFVKRDLCDSKIQFI